MQHKVIVWGKECPVIVEQVSKSVVVAVGDYMGSSIRVQDRSVGSALKRWREAATSAGG